MRIRVFSVLILLVIGGMTWSLIWGQERTPPTTAKQQPTSRQTTELTVPTSSASSSLTRGPARDFSKLDELQIEMLTSCQRGADWLARVNGVKGRFSPGLVPELKTEIEGDHFLRQAGAAYALARAARFLGEDRYAACAQE